MKIGIPKEVKNQEARVAITPEGVKQLSQSGHQILVEDQAGIASGFSNQHYQLAGATIVTTAQAWQVDLVVKVKEPQKSEYGYLAQQIIFTFFHLSGVDKALTETLIKKGSTALAYESLEDNNGQLPILQPMSAIAGNMAVLMGAYYLANFNAGNGMQLGTILHQPYGKVVIIGDGIVGQHAANTAAAMGTNVAIAGLNDENWRRYYKDQHPNVHFFISNKDNIAQQITDADLVIAAVLNRGAKAVKVVSEQMLKTMNKGTVIVDVSIDQGGCFETSKPTTHSNPVFIKHGVIHYCVSNMPGAYPKASTIALTNVTIDYIQDIADNALQHFLTDSGKIKAINVHKGWIRCQQVAKDLDLLAQYQPIPPL